MSARLPAITFFLAALLLARCAERSETPNENALVKDAASAIQVKDAASAIQIARNKCAAASYPTRGAEGTWHAGLHRGVWDAQFVYQGDTGKLPYLEVHVVARTGKADGCNVRVIAD